MSYESDVKLINWKRSLDLRCAEHLKLHPEQVKTIYDRGAIQLGERPVEQPKLKVEVNQIDNSGNGWEVVRNGVKLHAFYGLESHRRALEFANKLCDIDSNDAVIPNTRCIYCGNYLHHRSDCPELLKPPDQFPSEK